MYVCICQNSPSRTNNLHMKKMGSTKKMCSLTCISHVHVCIYQDSPRIPILYKENVFSMERMCSLWRDCVLYGENVFSRMFLSRVCVYVCVCIHLSEFTKVAPTLLHMKRICSLTHISNMHVCIYQDSQRSHQQSAYEENVFSHIYI